MPPPTSSYDDGESLPDPGDGFDAEHHPVLQAIRTVHDAHVRKALMILFVLAVLRGRIGR